MESLIFHSSPLAEYLEGVCDVIESEDAAARRAMAEVFRRSR